MESSSQNDAKGERAMAKLGIPSVAMSGSPMPADDIQAELRRKLRAPLNAVVGLAELLKVDPSNTASDEIIGYILGAAREMSEIVNLDQDLPDLKETSETAPDSSTRPICCDVLYIEDRIANYVLVESILNCRPELTVLHADCGEAGIRLARSHKPKLILLDLNLPDMHGSEVLERLKKQSETAKIPVVVVSADAMPSQIERLLAAGAHDYLTKPLTIAPFFAVVDAALTD
jgi:CheY-like chemotaxis protein